MSASTMNEAPELIGKVEELSDKVDVLVEAVHALATHIDERFTKTEAIVATKDFVERRIEVAEERLIVEIRRGDAKVEKLVATLGGADILTEKEAKAVMATVLLS